MKNFLVLFFVIVLSITSVYGQDIAPIRQFDGELLSSYYGAVPSYWVEISQEGYVAYESFSHIIIEDQSVHSLGSRNFGRLLPGKRVFFFNLTKGATRETVSYYDPSLRERQDLWEDSVLDFTTDAHGVLYVMTSSGIFTWDGEYWNEIVPGDWDVSRYQVQPGQQKIAVTQDGEHLAIKQGAERLLYTKQKNGVWKVDQRLSISANPGDTSAVSEVYLADTQEGLILVTPAGDDAIWVYKEKSKGNFVGCFKKGFKNPFVIVDSLLISGNFVYDLNHPAFDTDEVEFTGKPLAKLAFDLAGRESISDVAAVWKEGTNKQVLLVAVSAKGDYYKNLPNCYWVFEVPIRRVPQPVVAETKPILGCAFWEESTIHVGNSTSLTLHVVARPKGTIEEVLVNGKPIRAARNKGSFFKKLKVNKNTSVEVTFRKRDPKTEKKVRVVVPREDLSIVGVKTPKWKENLGGYKYDLLPGKFKLITEGDTKWYTLFVRLNGRADFKPDIQ